MSNHKDTAIQEQLGKLRRTIAERNMAREQVAKELDTAAQRFSRQAESAVIRELSMYYRGKAKSARDKAAAIRAGKDAR